MVHKIQALGRYLFLRGLAAGEWLWAVVQFIPAAVYIAVVGLYFYLFVPLPKEDSSQGDHHYLSYFDDLEP